MTNTLKDSDDGLTANGSARPELETVEHEVGDMLDLRLERYTGEPGGNSPVRRPYHGSVAERTNIVRCGYPPKPQQPPSRVGACFGLRRGWPTRGSALPGQWVSRLGRHRLSKSATPEPSQASWLRSTIALCPPPKDGRRRAGALQVTECKGNSARSVTVAGLHIRSTSTLVQLMDTFGWGTYNAAIIHSWKHYYWQKATDICQ
ncbi:unnamed protein product [Phytophthora fragariaefolia]|uniref:Unnamed protein product n=1 Tax=Phytophthora fragariaefolia TaxID=1490495 RepID=A0A9W6WTZ5_9STRA|nr:unnamed protein product [Phytophthora fragariaefolia]